MHFSRFTALLEHSEAVKTTNFDTQNQMTPVVIFEFGASVSISVGILCLLVLPLHCNWWTKSRENLLILLFAIMRRNLKVIRKHTQISKPHMSQLMSHLESDNYSYLLLDYNYFYNYRYWNDSSHLCSMADCCIEKSIVQLIEELFPKTGYILKSTL